MTGLRVLLTGGSGVISTDAGLDTVMDRLAAAWTA
jgi:hypothetical protein